MQITVRGHGLEITEPLRDYAHKKISKLQQYFNNIQRVEVSLETSAVREAARCQVAQVTMWVAGKIIRAVEESGEMYSSIDMVFGKLERQIKKYKGKKVHESRRKAHKIKEEAIEKVTHHEESKGPVIVKTKRFAMKPLAPQEAVDQMELLGHDFYMFLSSKSHEINVVYRRKSGNYGLIEPEV